MARKHRERPISRINPSGKKVWLARPTGPDGKYSYRGTFKRQGPCDDPHDRCCAQHAIDAAYAEWERPGSPESFGAYAKSWTEKHPRAERTNDTNDQRIRVLLDVEIEDVALRDWQFRDLKRRHVNDLVDHLLRHGRTATGVGNALRTLSAMAEDAITDEVAEFNAFKGVKVRRSDVRVIARPRKKRIWTFEQMHAFAAAAGRYEPMLRVLADCGPRIGELLAIRREGLDLRAGELRFEETTWNGRISESSPEKKHDRIAPLSPECVELLRRMPMRIDSPWLFATLSGKVWQYNNFRRDVWLPTIERAGIDPRPHEFRHSWMTHLRAAGIDPADLADIAGNTVATATAHYTHALRRSFDEVRKAIA